MFNKLCNKRIINAYENDKTNSRELKCKHTYTHIPIHKSVEVRAHQRVSAICGAD